MQSSSKCVWEKYYLQSTPDKMWHNLIKTEGNKPGRLMNNHAEAVESEHTTIRRIQQDSGAERANFQCCSRNSSFTASRIQGINPFPPTIHQYSPCSLTRDIIHHTVWRTWLFIAYSCERWLYYQFSLPHLYNHISLKGSENVLFELGNERKKW